MSKKKPSQNPKKQPKKKPDSDIVDLGASLQPSDSASLGADPFDLGEINVNEVIDHTGTIGIPPTEMSMTLDDENGFGDGNGNGNGEDYVATQQIDDEYLEKIHSIVPPEYFDSQQPKSGSRISYSETQTVEGMRIPDGPEEMIPPLRDIQFPSTDSLDKGKTKEPALEDSDEYHVVSKLGSGGYGIVYEAQQTALNRSVAVKVLKPRKRKGSKSGGSGTGTGTGETKKRQGRFLHEAKITARLQHPNIIPLYDFGVNPRGELFYSMKKVEKRPWSAIIKRPLQLLGIESAEITDKIKRDAIKRNIEIFADVCDGMAYAHSQEIVHRDLKPENVMIGEYNEVLIIDFGMALDLAVTDREFTAGGTLVYMAPEMARHYDKQKSIQYVVRQTARNLGQETGSIFIDQMNLKGVRVLAEGLIRESGDSTIVKLAEDLLTLDEEEKELARQITKSSDVYLMGAILYEIAVGHPPHYVMLEHCLKEANTTKTNARQVKQKHELRLALNNQIQQYKRPHDPLRISLRDIALKAMKTDPTERFQSIQELREAIRDFQQQVQGLELAEIGKELVAKASGRSDYQHLLPALESFRGARELWPDDETDILQIETACTYGNRAFARKDFDAGLDILDEYVEADSKSDKNFLAVRQKLEHGKKIRNRNRTLAAVGWLAAVLLPIAVGIGAFYYTEAKTKELVAKRDRAVQEAEAAETAKKEAIDLANDAREAARKAGIAKGKAETAKGIAETAKINAEDLARSAKEEAKNAGIARDSANALAKRAKDDSNAAIALQIAAERKASEFQFASELSDYFNNVIPIPLEFRQGNPRGVMDKLRALAGSTAKAYLKNGWLVRHYNRKAEVKFDRPVKLEDSKIIVALKEDSSTVFVLGEKSGRPIVAKIENEVATELPWNLPADGMVIGGALSPDGTYLAIAIDGGSTPIAVFETSNGNQIDLERQLSDSRGEQPSEVEILGCRNLTFGEDASGQLRLVSIEELSGKDGLKQRLQIAVRQLEANRFRLVGEVTAIGATTRDERPLSPKYVSHILAGTSKNQVAIAYPTLDAQGRIIQRLETIEIDLDGRSQSLGLETVSMPPTALHISNDELLYCGYADGKIRQLDFANFAASELEADVRTRNINESRILSMITTPDNRLVSGSENGKIVVWNKQANGGTNRELNFDQVAVSSIQATMEDNELILITGDDGGNLLHWKPDSNEQFANARLDKNGGILVAAVDENRNSGAAPALAVGKSNGDVLYYGPNDLLNAKPVLTINSDEASTQTSYRFKIKSPFNSVDLAFKDFDAMGIVSENAAAESYFFVLKDNGAFTHSEIQRVDGKVKVVESSKEHQITSRIDEDFVPLVTANEGVGYFFTTNPSDARKLLAWQVKAGKLIAKGIDLEDMGRESNVGVVRRIALSSDGRWLAVVRSVAYQFVVQMYQLENVEDVKSLSLNAKKTSKEYTVDEPAFIAFSPASDTLAFHTHPTGGDRQTWIRTFRLDGSEWTSEEGQGQRIGLSKHGVVSWIEEEGRQRFIGKDNRRYYVTFPDNIPDQPNWISARGFRPAGESGGYYVLEQDAIRIDDLSGNESGRKYSTYAFKNAKGLRVFGKDLIVLDQDGFHLVDDQLNYQTMLSARENPIRSLSLANQRLAVLHDVQGYCRLYDVGGKDPILLGRINDVEKVELSPNGEWVAAKINNEIHVYQCGVNETKYVEKFQQTVKTNTHFDWIERQGAQYLLVAQQDVGPGLLATQWMFLDPVTAKPADGSGTVLPTELAELQDFELAPLTHNYLATKTVDGIKVWGVAKKFAQTIDGKVQARMLPFDATGLDAIVSMSFSEIEPASKRMEDVGTRLVVLNGKASDERDNSQEMSIFLLASEIPEAEPDAQGEAGELVNNEPPKEPRFRIEQIEGALEDISSREFLSAEFSGDGRTLLQVDTDGVTALLSK